MLIWLNDICFCLRVLYHLLLSTVNQDVNICQILSLQFSCRDLGIFYVPEIITLKDVLEGIFVLGPFANANITCRAYLGDLPHHQRVYSFISLRCLSYNVISANNS